MYNIAQRMRYVLETSSWRAPNFVEFSTFEAWRFFDDEKSFCSFSLVLESQIHDSNRNWVFFLFSSHDMVSKFTTLLATCRLLLAPRWRITSCHRTEKNLSRSAEISYQQIFNTHKRHSLHSEQIKFQYFSTISFSLESARFNGKKVF